MESKVDKITCVMRAPQISVLFVTHASILSESRDICRSQTQAFEVFVLFVKWYPQWGDAMSELAPAYSSVAEFAYLLLQINEFRGKRLK